MHQFSIPTCYFPSTTLFLDDNRDFLLNFVLQLDESVAYRIFSDPNAALALISQRASYLNIFSQTEKGILPIHEEIYNPNRFAEISVIVVDYAMPGINGLDFCRQIENPNIKKILLTGQADEKLATAAFNEGLIHRYIKKNELHAAELITKSIAELQLQYFQGLSKQVESKLAIAEPACLQDKAFIQFFRQICEDNHIVEYYLLDDSGSFLLLDQDAHTHFLILKTEDNKKAYYQLAQQQGAAPDILAQLLTGQKIPLCVQSDLATFPWQDCLHSLTQGKHLQGEQAYYYAYVKTEQLCNIRQQKILSYHRYMEELDAAELLS